MKISNHTEALEKRFGAVSAVRMNCEAGFEAVDYSMYETDSVALGAGGIALARELKKTAMSYGVSFNQAHAPFSRFKLGEENADHNRMIYYSVLRSVEIAAELGAPIIVVHPSVICPHLSKDDRFNMNMEFYSRVIARAKPLGVTVAIENMWGRHKDFRDRIVKSVCSDADEMIKYIDALSPDAIACLDVGHCGLVGEAADDMALKLGERLGAIHIHDNDFVRDLHTAPFVGKMNFAAITKALHKIGYTGDITLEANYFTDNMPDELVPAALSYLARCAAYLRDKV